MRVSLPLLYFLSIVLFALPPSQVEAQPVATDQDVIIYSGTPSHTISCFPSSEGASATTQNFDEYYLKNYGNECALVSDINLKIKAGLIFSGKERRDEVYAYANLMRCMGGCYSKDKGTSASPECMEKLCKCNQQIVQQNISCGGTNNGFDCEAIKTALEKHGGAMLFVLHQWSALGHAVQVESIDCNLGGGMFSGGFYRDPNQPEKTQIFLINNKTSKVSKLSEGSIAGMIATGQYTANPS